MSRFLLWWLLVCIIAISTIAGFHYDGFIKLWEIDKTKMSFVILTIFYAFTFYMGQLIYKQDRYKRKVDYSVIDACWYTTETLVNIGLLGTIGGFIYMLYTTFIGLDFASIENAKEIIQSMSIGMGMALFTTLLGLGTSIIAGLQIMILETKNE